MRKTKAKRAAAKRQNQVFFGVRLDLEVVDLLRERAKRNDRTIAGETNRVLRMALAQPEKEGIGQ